MYNSFREMPVWQQAMAMAEQVFHLTESLPRKEDYGLTSQIRRSALSVPANIAEGFGRMHSKEKINLYYVARGSIAETQSHLEYGRRVGYFDAQKVMDIDKLLSELWHDVNKVIATLRARS